MPTDAEPGPPPQARIYEQLAGVGHALSNSHRLKMLNLLAHGEKTVGQLAEATGQTTAAASANIRLLRNANLVAARKQGRTVHCRLTDDRVGELWLRLRDLGEVVLPEVRETMREEFDDASPISERELFAEIEGGGVTLLDLRPEEEYAAGHLPSARSVPFDVLGEAEPDLPRQGPLYVYCRGPFCARAVAGHRLLRKATRASQRLRFSVPEWRAAGLPVE
ncbi:ArsR/SmtB family transcription factor [Alienimonas chondri]|uniref:ArsR family transcriptional regulator n=1 Tax=Alienimonas chondri TaxID=2681879 RepID=A0ABX1VDV7_9PLAN|nr:metalloregulator ArsR/SmtB family transcription factor [Alienimonas chondri]NNJ25924.1 hypothetical protein [Alienimonas chondri]